MRGGQASNRTKAFSIDIKKCEGYGCSTNINYDIDGLIITVMAVQEHVDLG